jgi:hypothetical protein
MIAPQDSAKAERELEKETVISATISSSQASR